MRAGVIYNYNYSLMNKIQLRTLHVRSGGGNSLMSEVLGKSTNFRKNTKYKKKKLREYIFALDYVESNITAVLGWKCRISHHVKYDLHSVDFFMRQ